MSIDLPTNIDTTYADTGDPSRKVHQQQHDEIHQRLKGVIVYHGSTASTARPVNATAVIWVGTVDPNNKASGDYWKNPNADVEQRWTGTAWKQAGSGTYLALLGPDNTVNRRRIDSIVPPFAVSTDFTKPSLLHPWGQRGVDVTVQNVGPNPASLYLSTSTDYSSFSTPGTTGGFTITLPAGQEYVAGAESFALWAYAASATRLRLILSTEADAA